MLRMLLCLPVCLLLAPAYPRADLPDMPPPTPGPTYHETAGPTDALLVLGANPLAAFPANLPWMSLGVLGQRSESPKQAVALLAFGPTPSFPGALNWAALHQATNRKSGLDTGRPDGDPVLFLAKCLERHDRDAHTYSTTMRKTEKIGGKLQPTEIVEVHFRNKPFSVHFNWKQGARDARRTLYVEGENDNKMITVTNLGLTLPMAPDSILVKGKTRYLITAFGFRKSTERIYHGWKDAQARGVLHVEYLGLRQVPEAGDRWCHVLRRTKYDVIPEDQVEDLTLFFDRDTLLQVGTVLRDREGHLIGEYYFRDVRLNPEFEPWQFEPAGLKK